MLTKEAINSNIKYYQSLQKKYSELYRESLRQETLMIQARIKLNKK